MSFQRDPISFLLSSVIVVLAISACAPDRLSSESGKRLSAEQTAPAERASPLDFRAVMAFCEGLKSTDTHLVLTFAEFEKLSQLLPASFINVLSQIIKQAGIKEVEVNGSESLIRIELSSDGYDWLIPDQGLVHLDQFVSLIDVVSNNDSGIGAKVQIEGVSFNGDAVLAVVPHSDLSFALELGSGAAINLNAPNTGALKQPQGALPTAGSMLQGFFAVADAMAKGGNGNLIQIVGMELRDDGSPQLDSQGSKVINRDSTLRKLLRAMLVDWGTPPQYLALFDVIAEVRLDKSGIKFWLSQPVNLNFSQGNLFLSPYVEFRSVHTGAMVPMQGVSARANGADGAAIQSLNVRQMNQSTILDAYVYGYRSTLFGRMGQSSVISFQIPSL